MTEAYCPYCKEEIKNQIYEEWSELNDEFFNFICPKCGKKMIIMIEMKPNFMPLKI